MDLYFEVLDNERVHPVVDHEDGAVGRIENGEIKNGSDEVLVFAEFLRPLFELGGPFVLVFFEVVRAIEKEGELVVVIVGETKDAHHTQIKFLQVAEIFVVVLLDLQSGFIGYAQGVTTHEVLDFHKIDQVL
jgi:hypothetical protein